MGILVWDKPQRAMPLEQWYSITADNAPPGVYTPNMSQADAERWKAKLTGTHGRQPQVEIRKSVGACQMVVVVGLDGYDYGTYTRQPADGRTRSTRGKNIHFSLNGPAQLTFDQFYELVTAVTEAQSVLRRWELI